MRPSRRALPPDRFGEAAADEELLKALTSSSSDEEHGARGGSAAARGRRVTTTTVEESDDDDESDGGAGDDAVASATTSARPDSESECDGTRGQSVACARERTAGRGGDAAERARPRRCCRPTSQCFFLFSFTSTTSLLTASLVDQPKKKNLFRRRRGNLGPEPALLPPAPPQRRHAETRRAQGKDRERKKRGKKWRKEKEKRRKRREKEKRGQKVRRFFFITTKTQNENFKLR